MHRSVAALCLAAGIGLAQGPTIGGCPVFPADNIWNTPVDTLPVSPNTSAWVNTIGATTGLKADFGSGLWNGGPIGIPFITVPASQTAYPATFLYQDESDPGPYKIPLDAPIEGGSQSNGDRHAIAVDIGNCVLYELYRAFPQSASWQADSGAIFNLLSHALRPRTWTSADAAGLPIFAGLVRYDEILAGEIRHAIRFTAPQTRREFVWPARHYASSLTGSQYPPMGARFRLRANFDISTFSPTNQIILRAMKKYGIMLADNGSAWFISGAPDSRWNNDDLRDLLRVKGSDWEAVDVSPLMINIDSGQARQSTAVSVTVTPSSANVTVNTTRQFTATVNNTANQNVSWGVNGVTGGNPAVGTISATGLYTAPGAPINVTVQAASQEDPSAVGTAAVSVRNPVSVSVSPTSATVRVRKTQTFTATVQNAANSAVTWRVNGIAGGNGTVGTISSLGTYRAPNKVPNPPTVTVSATSVEDPTKSASAFATIVK
jgi:hypothetical protein